MACPAFQSRPSRIAFASLRDSNCQLVQKTHRAIGKFHLKYLMKLRATSRARIS